MEVIEDIKKFISIFFITFLLMLTMNENLSIIFLSPKACQFIEIMERNNIVWLRIGLFVFSAVLTGIIVKQILNAMELTDLITDNYIIYCVLFCSIVIVAYHAMYTISGKGGYAYLVISQKDAPLGNCAVPLDTYFLRLKQSAIDSVDLSKLAKIDLNKLPKLDSSKLKELGLFGATSYDLNSMSQMNKDELIAKLERSRGK